MGKILEIEFLNIRGCNIKKLFVLFILFQISTSLSAFAQTPKSYEYDLIRAELSVLKDKNSPQYKKTKQKLERYISQNKIDYSTQARIEDVERLIQEQKYNSAIYELNDLIENNIEPSLCYMLLGDISFKSAKNPKKTASYYKQSLQYNPDNYLSSYKLAKLYLKENKNILGIEYLKHTIQKTNDENVLKEIEYIILNKITPEDKYDANNLYEALGDIYNKLGKKDDSYIAYTKAIKINPNDIFLKYYLGDLYFCDCKDNEAISVYDDILKDYPNDTMVKISKAKAYANTGNLLNAEKEFNEVLAKIPNSSQAIYGLYKIYERKYTPDKILERIYKNKENYKVNQQECLNFAKFLEEMNDEKGAKNFKKFALKLDEAEKEKLLAQKKAIENQKQNLTQKEENKIIEKKDISKTQKKQTESNKLSEKEKKQLKDSLQKEKQKQEQLKKQKQQEEKLQLEKEDKIIQQERKKAISKDPKKYYEYKATLDNYLKMTPKDASIYTAIGNTYKLMGEPTSALQNFREAQKLNPTDSDIYYNIGLTYMELNSFVTAKANLIKAVNLNKENEKAIKLLGFVNQKIITQIVNNAYNEYEKKEYLKASSILDEGLKNYPKNSQMLYYRALVYDAMNRNAAQIIDLQKAIEYDPGYYMAYYQLGKAYEKIKDEKSALVAYEKFLSTEPEEKDLIEEVQKKVIALGAKYY